MGMLEKRVLLGFYMFWIIVSAIFLCYYGFSLYTGIHLGFTFLVPVLGILLLRMDKSANYICFGILSFYAVYQVLYSPWLIHITYGYLFDY